MAKQQAGFGPAGLWIGEEIWRLGLPLSEAVILADIASFDSTPEGSFKSHGTRAKQLGLDRSTVIRAINKLKEKDLVVQVGSKTVRNGAVPILRSTMTKTWGRHQSQDATRTGGETPPVPVANCHPENTEETTKENTTGPADRPRQSKAEARKLVGRFCDLYRDKTGRLPSGTARIAGGIMHWLKAYHPTEVDSVITFFFNTEGRKKYGFEALQARFDSLAPIALGKVTLDEEPAPATPEEAAARLFR